MAGSADARGAPPRKVALVALGCRVNQADADELGSALPSGFVLAGDGERADVVVVNTCSVTADADAAARQAIRRAAREHPGARIVAAGCYAELSPGALAALPGVAAVVGARGQAELPGVLARLGGAEAGAPALAAGAFPAATPWTPAPLATAARRTRPVLKLQDGCDATCSYCVVPLARGPSRSLPFDEALRRILVLGADRAELVLAGVHLGAYGKDLLPARSLAELVRAAVAGGLRARLRLSSIEPLEVPLDLFRDPGVGGTVCEHLHVPVQSGSDAVLAAMRRPYRADDVRRIVLDVAAALPGACLGADLIVGFPGERDEDHRATVALVEGLPLAYLHVFPFSPRAGTPAATLPGAVPAGVVRERARELRAISERRWGAFLAAQVGRELEVVVERASGGLGRGTARAYATVRWSSAGERRGALARVRVVASDGDVCSGVLVAVDGGTPPGAG